ATTARPGPAPATTLTDPDHDGEKPGGRPRTAWQPRQPSSPRDTVTARGTVWGRTTRGDAAPSVAPSCSRCRDEPPQARARATGRHSGRASPLVCGRGLRLTT